MIWQSITPSPILWHVGPLTIRWYGLIFVLAIIAGCVYAYQALVSRQIVGKKAAEDLFFYLIIFGLVGARLGHVIFFSMPYYVGHPLDIVKIWHGGISIQGALLAGILTIIWWCKKNSVNIWQVLDCLVPAMALGQAIGRWGNYFNQELFGRPTDNWWGIYIEPLYRPIGYEANSLFHPTFFYESLMNLLLFVILHKLLRIKAQQAGFVTLVYFAGYGLIRFFMEFVRIDQTQIVFGARLPQLISLVVLILAVRLILYKHTGLLSKNSK